MIGLRNCAPQKEAQMAKYHLLKLWRSLTSGLANLSPLLQVFLLFFIFIFYLLSNFFSKPICYLFLLAWYKTAVTDVFKAMDTDGDGEISQGEVTTLATTSVPEVTSTDVANAWASLSGGNIYFNYIYLNSTYKKYNNTKTE
jgi:hypothetical protein